MITAKESIATLKLATQHLRAAQKLVKSALGDTDSAKTVTTDIELVIEDLDADIIYFRDGVPN
jgi:exonuclease VII small subunit